VLEVTQTAVNELAARRARGAAEIALFHEDDAQPASGSVAGYPRAVDAAADDEEVSVRPALPKVGRLPTVVIRCASAATGSPVECRQQIVRP
jgi:hypothetical protein